VAIPKQTLDELLKLPPEQRLELAEELWDSVEAHDPEWQRAWSQEIARRLETIADGRAELIDADVVHAELRAELQNPSR
jgi:putative addiction module component (TIGR02574 family)